MRKKDFDGLMQGLREALAHARGEDVPGLKVHVPANPAPKSGVQGGPVLAQAGAKTGTARAHGHRRARAKA
jgi:hypothetical protein